MIRVRVRRKKNGVPILTKAKIEAIAEAILAGYNPGLGAEPAAVDIEHLAETHMGLEMDYQDLSHNRSILGMTVFSDCLVPVYDADRNEAKHIRAREGTILIDNSLLSASQIRRGRFTVGHELGHWLLHRHCYAMDAGQLPLCSNPEFFIRCRRVDIENRRRQLVSDDDWLEWQADCLSSALLMPRKAFALAAWRRFRSVGIEARFYARGTHISLDLWTDYLTFELADLFEVSIQAARIRLENLQLIRKKRETGCFTKDKGTHRRQCR
jgi:Zn-dependent peptidase ImmA (M78 family)